MSVSNLFNPICDYDLYCNSITAKHINTPTNQIFWNSYDSLYSPAFIGPGTELSAYNQTFAIANNNITFLGLGCGVDVAPGIGNSWIFTLYKNGSATSLITTLSDNNISAFSNGSVSLVQGDTFAVSVVSISTPNTAQGAVTLSYN